MERISVIVDGNPAGVLPDLLVRDDGVHVPAGAFCACIGVRFETRGGQAPAYAGVVCSGDLCVPVSPSGSAGRGDVVFVSLEALSGPLGLTWELLRERGELRVTTGRPEAVPVRAGAPAPDFTLPDLDGRPVSVRGFRGHKVAFYVWASW